MVMIVFQGLLNQKPFVYRAVPSKSFTHRYLILSALAGEGSEIRNPLTCDDSAATLRALEVMGTLFHYKKDKSLEVLRGLNLEEGELRTNRYGNNLIDCKDSASTLRFLMALGLRFHNPITFDGSEGLTKRPLDSYIEFFKRYGLRYEWEGSLPIKIQGPLGPGRYEIGCDISSQYASGLLMLLSSYEEESVLVLKGPIESLPYIAMTITALRRYGKIIEVKENEITIRPSKLEARKISVEGDYSQAANFMAMGSLGKGCRILDLEPESVQGDRVILDILTRLGVRHYFTEDRASSSGYALIIEGSELKCCEVDVRDCPDLTPVIALLMSLADGRSLITGCRRLVYKESNRLEYIAEILNYLGARVSIEGDNMLIEGVTRLNASFAKANGDHRLAMMMAAASVRAGGPITVQGFDAVAKSYTNFLKDFSAAGGHYEEFLDF